VLPSDDGVALPSCAELVDEALLLDDALGCVLAAFRRRITLSANCELVLS